MKEYATDQLRNVVIAGHGSTGKTTLTDALLYKMKELNRIGAVDAGTTVSDYTDEERKRKISIHLTLAHGEWRENKINLMDVPGYSDFEGELFAGLHVADGALIVMNAVNGVEAGTEKVFQAASERKIPVVLCANMLDRDNADFARLVEQAREFLHPKAVPLQIPIGTGPNFRGLIDLFKMKAYLYEGGDEPKETDIPADMADEAQAAREALIEAVADFDDDVIVKYLDGQPLTSQEILSALRLAVTKAGAFPIVVTSAAAGRGVRRLLDTMAVCFPSPAQRPAVPAKNGDADVELKADPAGPLAAQVFKTVIEQHVGELSLVKVYSGTLVGGTEVYNVTRSHAEKTGQLYLVKGKERKEVGKLVAGDIGALVKLRDTHTGDTLCEKSRALVLPPVIFPEPVSFEAIVPKVKGEEDKIGVALHRLMEEDPTIRLQHDPDLHQMLLYSMGELHTDVILEKLREKHVDVELRKPRIHYRETITRVAQGQGRYKKQTGGRGQFGDVWIKLEPQPRGAGFEFVDEIVGGVVPGKFIPAVEKGLIESMKGGILAGYPAVDMKASLYDGSYHTVDSSEMAFKVAASMAFKKLMEEAGPVMLEPIMILEVYAPDENTGDVMGDLSSRRGKILGMEQQGRGQTVRAYVPQGELYRYGATLRSLTQGRGWYKVSFHAYEEIPRDQKDRIISEAKAALEES